MSKLMVLFILFILESGIYCNKFMSDKGIIDLRFTCVNNLTRRIYLPLGVGKMESVSLFISTKFVKPQCKLKFYTYPEHNIGIILVINIFEGSLVNEELFVQDNNIIDVNELPWESKSIYRYQEFPRNISLIVNMLDGHDKSLKVIATSVEFVKDSSECGENALDFTLSNKTICISKELQCDGNPNCGVKLKFDEDSKICRIVEAKLLWVILLTMLMAFILQRFLIHWISKLIPKVPKDSFVYATDEMVVSRYGTQLSKMQESTEDFPQSSARTSSNL